MSSGPARGRTGSGLEVATRAAPASAFKWLNMETTPASVAEVSPGVRQLHKAKVELAQRARARDKTVLRNLFSQSSECIIGAIDMLEFGARLQLIQIHFEYCCLRSHKRGL